MILTCVGTGTAAPQPDRVCSGFLLETSGLRILFDCGSGVVHAMARRLIDWQTITHLALSHFHNDHIGDVPMLFFAWKYGMRPARATPLVVIGPSGTRQLLARMADVFGTHLTETNFPVEYAELQSGQAVRLNDTFELRACKTPHTPESLAYRVDGDGRAFCYTGDTGRSEEVAKFAQGVDAMVTECSMPEAEAMDTHLTPARVVAMARVALPKRLVLTHVYPQLERARVPALLREAGWPAPVELPDDGTRIEL